MLMSTAVALFTLLTVAPAHAETATVTKGGAFASLSPGNQKIARALYEAQTASTFPKLTLEQIAKRKQEAKVWGNVFREMKAQRRVDARNLDSVVSASSHQRRNAVGTAGTSVAVTGGTSSAGTASTIMVTATGGGK